MNTDCALTEPWDIGAFKPKPKSYAASCTPCDRQRATGQIRGDLELALGPWMDLRGIPEALQQPAIKCPVQRNGNLFDAI